MKKLPLLFFMMICMLLAVMLPLPTPPQSHAQEPTQGVQPQSGPAGTEFAFFAVGFDDKEKLGYWFHAPDGTLYRNDKDYRIHAFEGRVDWKWRVPHNAAPGTWTAIIQGIRSKQQAVITFEVIVYDPQAATQAEDPISDVLDQNVSPHQGTPGTEFAFYAYGYDEREQVAYWFTSPEGDIITTPENIIHSRDGRVDISWKSPYDAMPGTWTATIKGRESGVQRVLYFDIYLPEGVAPIVDEDAENIRSTEKAVAPQVGEAGTKFAFFARGFNEREKVGYWFNAPDGSIVENRYLYVVTANGDRADWNWQSPENAIPGIWTAVAKGEDSQTERLIPFEIGDPSNPTITTKPAVVPDQPEQRNDSDVAVEPPEGPPGTRFAFSAGGFPPGETIKFWASDPQGTNYEKDKYLIKSNEVGVAYWNWSTPENAVQGTWTMVARGQTAQVKKVIYFEVRDPNAPQRTQNLPPPQEFPDLPHGTNSPFVALEPIIAAPGSRFAFSAEGYPKRATVFFWAVDPNGEVYDNDNYRIRANESGVAYWNWKTPDDGVVGVWEMHAKHNISNFEHIIYFELGDPTAIPQVTFYNPQPAPQPAQQQPAAAAPIAPPQPAVLPENSTDVGIEPISGPPGSRFAFKAAGYPARELVTFWIVTPNGERIESDKYTIMSDQSGVAYWNWRTPEDALPGIWQMHALGDKSELEHVIYFQVTDPSATISAPSPAVVQPPVAHQPSVLPANNADVAVDPPADMPGARFAFKAGGYPARETVYFWAVAPDGTEYRKDKYEVMTDEAGVAYWNWKTPDDAMPGIWQMHVLGDSVVLEHVIYFQLLDPTAPAGTPPAPMPQQPSSNNDHNNPSVPVASTVPSAPTNSPDVAVDPPADMPGARFAFKAGGYPSRETVYFWAVAPDGTEYRKHKYKVMTDEAGVAYWNWKTPDDATPGIWQMHALGDSVELEHVIVFEVIGDGTAQLPQPAPSAQPQQPSAPQPQEPAPAAPSSADVAAVDPLAGTPGTRFAFKAGGYPSRETVYFWAVAPDGTEYRKHKYKVMTDEAGVAYWNWGTPEDGAPGTWHMYAKGDKSLVQHDITFEIYP